MRGRAVWTLLSGASVLLVSALANAQCTKDIDCKGDRVCDAGKCTSPLPPAPAAPPGSETPAGAAPAPGAAGAPVTPPADGQATPAAAAPGLAPGSVDLRLQPSPGNAAPTATPPLNDEPQTKRRSRNAMVGGIVMVSVGPIALLAALAAKNAQETCDTDLERDYPDHRLPPSEKYRADRCNDYSLPLYIFGIGGAVLTAAGIPLIIYGAKSVPNGPPRASLQVLPWAGPTSSGLRLRLDL